MTEKNRCRQLFFTFLKIGAFTFGGGYAMIPLIQKETVENKGWISKEDILDVVAVAESTPGPIALNAATFVGYQTAGVPGALCATAGVTLPSFFIILIISLCLAQFEHLKVIQYAFNGIRAGVLALIIKAMFSMAKQIKKNWFFYFIIIASFLATVIFHISVLLVILFCAAAGFFVSQTIHERKQEK